MDLPEVDQQIDTVQGIHPLIQLPDHQTSLLFPLVRTLLFVLVVCLHQVVLELVLVLLHLKILDLKFLVLLIVEQGQQAVDMIVLDLFVLLLILIVVELSLIHI